MKKFTLINIEWNSWNWFIIELLGVDSGHWSGDERHLFYANVSHRFLFIDLFWFKFKIFDKTDKHG